MPDLLAVHRAHLERFRGSMNLVGPGPLDPHFDDSLAAVGWLSPTGHWADLGTGAGFPGVPFAARFPDVQVDLVDSRRKRCIFLEGVVHEAGRSDISVKCTRIEGLADRQYDGIMARALAPPKAVAAFGHRLLLPGGTLLLLLQHDQPYDDDGYELIHIENYTVDGKRRRAVALKLAT